MAFNNKGLLTGFLLGVGVAWGARTVWPTFAPLTRPLAKVSLKAAVLGYERSREVAAGFTETLSDVFAEVQHELQTERAASVASAGAGLLNQQESQTISIEQPRSTSSSSAS